MNPKNKVADILKTFALVMAVLGGLGAIIVGISWEDALIFLVFLLAVAVTAFAIYAFGEIVQLLHDIKLNTSAHASGSKVFSGNVTTDNTSTSSAASVNVVNNVATSNAATSNVSNSDIEVAPAEMNIFEEIEANLPNL